MAIGIQIAAIGAGFNLSSGLGNNPSFASKIGPRYRWIYQQNTAHDAHAPTKIPKNLFISLLVDGLTSELKWVSESEERIKTYERPFSPGLNP